MPIKSDITNASDALWSAPVERESVIGALAAAPRSAALKLRRRPANWNSAVPCSIGSWHAIGPIPTRAAEPVGGSPIGRTTPRSEDGADHGTRYKDVLSYPREA